MSGMDWVQVIVGVLFALLVIYTAARVAGAAWFKSKREFDRQPKGR